MAAVLHPVTLRVLAVAASGWLLAGGALAVSHGPAVHTAATAPRGDGRAAARLRLEPFNPGVQRDPALRLTSELRLTEPADPRRRAEAAALWQALQRSPEQVAQEALRLQSAEREVRALGDTMRRNASAVTRLRDEVDQAGRGRATASAAVVGLAALLMAMLVWLAWRWHRESRVMRVGRWFEANSELGQPPMPVVDAAAMRRRIAPPSPPARARAHPAAAAQMAAPTSGWMPAEAVAAARVAPLRKVDAQEVVDLHDKADFFLSIGEHEQAIGMLAAHVHDAVETSPLAWLDLLELYRRFGRRAEYERLRAQYQGRFRAWTPGFDHFEQPAPGLDHHPSAMARIAALWPSPDVLHVIAELLFRAPELPGAEPFGREAYRDLVLLYHVARELAPQEEMDPLQVLAMDFDDTVPPAGPLREPDPSTLDPLLVPPASPRLGVDIDLGETEPAGTASPLDFDICSYEPTMAGGGKR